MLAVVQACLPDQVATHFELCLETLRSLRRCCCCYYCLPSSPDVFLLEEHRMIRRSLCFADYHGLQHHDLHDLHVYLLLHDSAHVAGLHMPVAGIAGGSVDLVTEHIVLCCCLQVVDYQVGVVKDDRQLRRNCCCLKNRVRSFFSSDSVPSSAPPPLNKDSSFDSLARATAWRMQTVLYTMLKWSSSGEGKAHGESGRTARRSQ